MPQTNPSLSAQNNHHVCSSQPYSMTVWLGTDGVVLVSARLLPFSIFCSPKWHLVHLSGVDWLLAKVMWWQNHMSLLLRPAWACSHGGQLPFKRTIRSMHWLLNLRPGSGTAWFLCCIVLTKRITCPSQMKGAEKWTPSFDGRGYKVILQSGGYFCTLFCPQGVFSLSHVIKSGYPHSAGEHN